jgi:hypothetical protein
MKLQINTHGSWRNLIEFPVERAVEVEDAAASLSRAAGGLKLRVVDDDGTTRWLNERGVFRGISHVGVDLVSLVAIDSVGKEPNS